MPTSDMEYLHKSGRVSYEQHMQMWTEMCARHEALTRMLGKEKHFPYGCDCVDIVLGLNGLLEYVKEYRRFKLYEVQTLKDLEIHRGDVFPFG